jgi:hypothetical protein
MMVLIAVSSFCGKQLVQTFLMLLVTLLLVWKENLFKDASLPDDFKYYAEHAEIEWIGGH